MDALIKTVALALLLSSTAQAATDSGFSYNEQESWFGVCVSGNTGRQSPINIPTASLGTNADLMPLEFGAGWNSPWDGTFMNGGHNVQFNLAAGANRPLTTTHTGVYELQQFHMHWGNQNGEGSEHLVGDTQYDLEVHFVHFKKDSNDTAAGDYASVVGVLLSADDDAAIDGVWQKLNASAITGYQSNISISDLDLTSLVPSTDSRGYYHYEGSLTTPGCNEIVQWFVLQETLSVPSAYLTYLRQIQDPNNEPLVQNFRMPQVVGDRVVSVQGGGMKIEASIVTLFSILILLCAGHI